VVGEENNNGATTGADTEPAPSSDKSGELRTSTNNVAKAAGM